jgi:hypothetical protein
MIPFFIICAVLLTLCYLVSKEKLGDVQAFAMFVGCLFLYLVIFE